MNLFSAASGTIIYKYQPSKSGNNQNTSLEPIKFIDQLKVNGELPEINNKVVEIMGLGSSTSLLTYLALNFIGNNHHDKHNLIIKFNVLINSINQLANPTKDEVIEEIRMAYKSNNAEDTFEKRFVELLTSYNSDPMASFEM